MKKRTNRRGTVLVLILGALALISVITVVYVTIGQGDRRSAGVTVRRDHVENVSRVFADYIADVVARGAFATHVDGDDIGPSGDVRPVLVRNAFDKPYTSPAMRSTGTNDARRFDPTGSYSTSWSGNLDPRAPGTPFLADAEPSWLVQIPLSNNLPQQQYRDLHLHRRDWKAITNIGPNGRFSNLANLRNNFDAQPGVGTANGFPRMSENLSLLDDNGQPTNQLPFGAGTANRDTPAHWSMYQIRAFRPAFGPWYNNTDYNRPDSIHYPHNQWVDTDGDGFFDARWFELIDTWDPFNIRELLPRDERYRWFAAARVIDLSALVNVNTASDFRTPPRAAAGPSGAPITPMAATPAGRSPADVDLRRLLTMSDLHFRRPNTHGYRLFAVGAEPYTQYNGIVAQEVGEAAHLYLDRWLRPQLPFGTVMSGDDRTFFYEDLASRATAGFQQGATPWYEMTRAFDTADLLELLTRRGINSPATSRLEEIVGGQGDTISPALERRLSALRDNRTLQDELHALDWNALRARAFYDIRQRLTTESGARPLRPAMFMEAAFRAGLSEDLDVQIDAYEALYKATRLSQPDPGPLFRAYAEALMPHAWRTDAWLPQRATLHYGYSAELALRIAAHMAANMAASYDRTHDQKGLTLVIDDSFVNDPLLNDVTRFPFWQDRSQPDRKSTLDLGAARLAPNNTSVALSARAVNIYSVEAQPFLTQVASIHVYTDAPDAAGGDLEANPPGPPGPRPPEPEITIIGGMSVPEGYPGSATGLSPDNLGQFIAFQLHNPFDVDINLTGQEGAAFPDYYLEYNGHLFRLADYTSNPAGESITLRAGETRIAVVASHEWSTLENHWIQVHPNPQPPGGGAELVRRFLHRQFAIDQTPGVDRPGELTLEDRVRPWIIRRMDPTTGQAMTNSADLFNGPSNSAAKGEVLLWRTVVRDQTATPSSPGYREAHLLADRMRDPALLTGATRATLDRSMPSGNHPISGAEGGPEGTGYNRGATIALWGSIKRSDDPGIAPGGTRTIPRGAIPAYCLEAKWGSLSVPGPGDLQNYEKEDPANPGGLSRTDFDPPPPIGGGGPPGQVGRPQGGNAGPTFVTFLSRVIQAPNATPNAPQPTIIPTLGELPQDRDNTSETIGANLDGRNYNQLYPEILLNNNRFDGELVGNYPPGLPILRVGDMLMPLAIGPSYDPFVLPTQNDPHPGRITLGEALALALNYDTPQLADPHFAVFHNLGAPANGNTGGSSIPGVLDRGHLVLDRFAPFEDLNSNGQFDAGSEPRRFPGIPLALNILNTFTITNEAQPGSLTRSTPGLINMNTAPIEVLRLVPLLSPTTEETPGGPDPFAWHTWLRQAGITGTTTMVNMDPSNPDQHSDIAAAFTAYRDKVRTFDRMGRANTFAETGTNQQSLLSDPNWNTFNGRWGTTLISALREFPGFATRGELMAVVDRTGPPQANNPAPPGNGGLPIPNQIDFLGQEGQYPSGTAYNSGAPGLVPGRYELDSTTRVTKINEIPDSYDEKLLIASAALGSLSVRSDVFAVWLVLHGYQRSDVENLRPDDPMVPTIAKRFVMVIDRSNVTRMGQKPRILLFKEVPMN